MLSALTHEDGGDPTRYRTNWVVTGGRTGRVAGRYSRINTCLHKWTIIIIIIVHKWTGNQITHVSPWAKMDASERVK